MNIPGIYESGSDKLDIDGPGKRLRSIREQQRLDITRVAARLHLGIAQLQALEEDAYDRLPASVFVRGYLRNYARILGEPEDEILAAYWAVNPDSGEPAKLIGKPPSTDTKISTEHGVVRLTTWVIVLLLVAAVVLWWRGYLREAGRQIVDTIESVSPVISAVSNESDTAEQQQALLEPFLQPEGKSDDKVAEPAATKAEVKTETASGDSQPEPASGPAQDSEPTPEADSTPAEEPQIAATPGPVVDVSAGSVVFEFTGTSWIKVMDAQGKVRLKGELNAGDRRKLRGDSPYSVIVGNVPAVSMMVNGRPFDMGPYTRRSVAKFTIKQVEAR